jgi:hypothetical protein
MKDKKYFAISGVSLFDNEDYDKKWETDNYFVKMDYEDSIESVGNLTSLTYTYNEFQEINKEGWSDIVGYLFEQKWNYSFFKPGDTTSRLYLKGIDKQKPFSIISINTMYFQLALPYVKDLFEKEGIAGLEYIPVYKSPKSTKPDAYICFTKVFFLIDNDNYVGNVIRNTYKSKIENYDFFAGIKNEKYLSMKFWANHCSEKAKNILEKLDPNLEFNEERLVD